MQILEYIRGNWCTLERSHRDLAQAAVDPKVCAPRGKAPVYLSAVEDVDAVTARLRTEMRPEDFEKIKLCCLPTGGAPIREHGLLYLPRPYVVPGGRFNELYGWDSFFIQMGLLRDGYVDLARDVADNLLYEIRHYGVILNANRTYYLTRSQPPLLTQMLLAVYNRTNDAAWLVSSLDAAAKYYEYWTREPHLTPDSGLSRYYDLGEGPAPEVLDSEIDAQGRNDYELVKEYFRTHVIDDYDVSRFYDAASEELTAQFYKGDRSMRESGFDPSNRFGPFSADIPAYNPVCLNALLYLMETQMAQILEIAGRANEAPAWRRRAMERGARINELLWDEAAGLYQDFHVASGTRRDYAFLTTFYPLWAGIASPQTAARVVSNLPLFECAGGLQTSTRQSGDQWDAPIGWAPLQWIAVQGLRRYGYDAEAERISRKFLSLVAAEFARSGAIDEKYDVVRCRSDIGDEILFGYRSNEAGFGWTNGVYTALYDELHNGHASAPARPG
jgi:alpha,alpha-trehalase